MRRTSPCPMKARGYERCDRAPRSFTHRRALQWLRRPLGSFSESRKKSRGMNSGCLGWMKGNLSACHNARLLWRGTCLVRVVWSHTVVGLQRLSATHAYQYGGSGSPVAMQISVASAVHLWRMSKCCKIWHQKRVTPLTTCSQQPGLLILGFCFRFCFRFFKLTIVVWSQYSNWRHFKLCGRNSALVFLGHLWHTNTLSLSQEETFRFSLW